MRGCLHSEGSSLLSIILTTFRLQILGALYTFWNLNQKSPKTDRTSLCKGPLRGFLFFSLICNLFFCPLIAQNTNNYLGPNEPPIGNPDLVRIQILVYNDPSLKGDTVVNASFAGTPIPLKPRDVYGYRGQASFQKRKGKYKLIWEVKRAGHSWPRTVTREEEVIINPEDLWIQISIVGQEASIS